MRLPTVFACVVLTSLSFLNNPAQAGLNLSCPAPGNWSIPATGEPITANGLFKIMSGKPVVLLGEMHTSAEHHRWQLQVIAGLFGRNSNMVIGFESFPRAVQPVLDQWSRGDLSEQEFLLKSRWFDVWRFNPDLYMPLFHFVRMNRIPMRALNVDRSFTRQVGKEGWAAIPKAQRRGLGDPAKPSTSYLDSLKEVFAAHGDSPSDKQTEQDGTAFRKFVDVQLTWDRAMAEALAEARTAGGDPLVVGIIGRGHLEYRYGVPHQLDDLGIPGSAVLLPSDSEPSCVGAQATQTPPHNTPVADAIFGVSAPIEPDAAPRPLLGVHIENEDAGDLKGVRILKVMDGSVASSAGLQSGDLIVKAADQNIANTSELVATIRRQAAGTWLPITVERDEKRIDVVAKFPARP